MKAMPSLTRIDYENRVFRAMNHISRNIERELPLEEIAGVAAFSPFHFHRIFKAVTGENVSEFTRRLRIELAANRLLAFSDRDVTQVALSCGFSSSQNFAKAFRQRYGKSPSEYRKANVGPEKAKAPSIDLLARGIPGREEGISLDVAIKEMPLLNAATIRRIGSYGETCAKAFVELLEWAGGRYAPAPGSLRAFYWDNPEVTPAGKCRFDCCLLVPEGADARYPIFLQKIGGGPWAHCRFETEPAGIAKAWEESFRWLIRSGYECRPSPCCEIYYNDAREHPEGKWLIDIAIPLSEG